MSGFRAVVGLLALAACGSGAVKASAPEPLPSHVEVALDATPKARARMVPPEAYLRAYMAWFGGLAPLEVQQKARGKGLFEAWSDYLAALGLPDYRLDLPRQAQSNALMLAALGRLAEALCVRAAEHDFNKKTKPDERVVFAFDASASPTPAQFEAGLDVLHRTFLGYPVRLAPADRIGRYRALYDAVRANHKAKAPLDPDQTAWVATCSALIQHPEAELY